MTIWRGSGTFRALLRGLRSGMDDAAPGCHQHKRQPEGHAASIEV